MKSHIINTSQNSQAGLLNPMIQAKRRTEKHLGRDIETHKFNTFKVVHFLHLTLSIVSNYYAVTLFESIQIAGAF